MQSETTPIEQKGLLSGITVVDMTRVLSGPYATMILRQLGARVIKIERPGAGDDSRAFGPFLNGKSTYFTALNCGKESIALDIKRSGDRDILHALLGQADVLVENFRPGVMRRYGLPEPYEQLKALTRGQGMTEATMRAFINGLDLPADAKQRLLALTPATYTGLASELARDI